jgi:hypothetical protein
MTTVFAGATHSPSKTGVNALVVVARCAAYAERRAGTRPAPTNGTNPSSLAEASDWEAPNFTLTPISAGWQRERHAGWINGQAYSFDRRSDKLAPALLAESLAEMGGPQRCRT